MKISSVKRSLNSLFSYLTGFRLERSFSHLSEREAMMAVRTIEKFNGQKLSLRNKKMANEYASDALGKKKYALWLYVYTLVRGDFREGWIPSNFFDEQVCPKVNKGNILTKTLSNVVLKTKLLPDIAYYIDGIFYDRDLRAIDIAALRGLVVGTYADVFVKNDYSSRGAGIMKLAVANIDENIFRQFGDCVIQSPIEQHDFFEKIISGSVATIRITTVKNSDGNIGMRGSYLRLGRSNTAWVQSANSVRVAITDGNGELDLFGYTQDWRRWLTHPDTNVAFSRQRIPLFKEAVETCVTLHRQIPHYTIIGWDVAIGNDDGIKLMEWQPGLDIKFLEATTGPCFTGLNWEKLRE